MTIGSLSNGSAAADVDYANEGDTVTLTVTPDTDSGYQLGILTVTGAGNYHGTASASWKITEHAMTVTADNVTAAYDGTSHSITVNVTDSASGAVVRYGTEEGTYSLETSPVFQNVGTYTVYYQVTANNYDTTAGSATVTINRGPVKVSGIKASDKPYDGTAEASLIYTAVTFNGLVSGDELSVTAVGTFDNADVGTGKTVTISDMVLGGADAKKYVLAEEGQQTQTTASITANPLNVTASGCSGTYDGKTHSITVTAPEGASVAYSESADGTYSAENPSYTIAGSYTVYYRLEKPGFVPVTGSETVSIGRRPVSVSGITAEDKLWDGDTAATLICSNAVFDGLLEGDELTVSAEGEFEDAEIGDKKTVSITTLTLEGRSATADFTITKAPHKNVLAEAATVSPGTKGARIDLSAYLEYGFSCAVSGQSGNLIDGQAVIDGDAVRIDTVSAEETLSGTVSVKVSSTNFQDYTVTVPLITSTRFPLRFDSTGGEPVTLTKSLTAGSAYGELPAPVRRGYAFDGWYSSKTGGEQATPAFVIVNSDVTLFARWTALEYSVTLELDGGVLSDESGIWSESGGSCKASFSADRPHTLPQPEKDGFVFAGWSREGNTWSSLNTIIPAGNTEDLTYRARWTSYAHGGSASFTGSSDITSRFLGILGLGQSADAVNSQTDGADSGIMSSVAASLRELAFNSMDSHTEEEGSISISLNSLNVRLDGNTVSQEEKEEIESVSVTVYGKDDSVLIEYLISRREVTVSGITAENKPYDGTTGAVLNYSGVQFRSLVEGDVLSVTAGGRFADAEIGTDKTVEIFDLTLGGESAGNYVPAADGQQKTAAASITENALHVTAEGYSGVYDGTGYSITVDAPEGARIGYSESGDGPFSPENPVFRNAGYYLVYYRVEREGDTPVTGSAAVSIEQRPVTVSGIRAIDRLWDGTTAVELGYDGVLLDGLVEGDSLTVSASVSIAKREVTVSGIKAKDKTYDGEVTAELDSSAAVFQRKLEDDTLTVTGVGTFDSPKAGKDKDVRITGLALGGPDAGNYILAEEGQQTAAKASILLKTYAMAGGIRFDGAQGRVTVELVDGGTVLTSATVSVSGRNGAYEFRNVPSGNYELFVTQEEDDHTLQVSMPLQVGQ